jgi:dinuclear metal center YbgI/SA1388 family protein
VHLPLDAHPDVGNNAQLARALGLMDCRRLGVYHEVKIGMAGELDQPTALDALAERLTEETGSPPLRVLRGGSGQARSVGCISGGAAMMMEQVAEEGLDTFVTGEMDHTHYHVAVELGLNVIFGGHYATETLGVRALGRHLSDRFGLRTVFLDVPTGM